MPNSPPTTHRITEFYKWHKEGSLNLAPPFQRKPVWSDRNKSFLIDTILSNLPVPEIYIQVKTDKTGNTKYIVVDGQQRMRSIFEFIEGEYSLDEEESISYGGREFTDLPNGVKRDFWDYALVVGLFPLYLFSISTLLSHLLYLAPLNSTKLHSTRLHYAILHYVFLVILFKA